MIVRSMSHSEMDELMKDSVDTITYEQHQSELYGHLGKTHAIMAELGLDHALAALIELRASQINACAYCVNMHITQARKIGVPQDKLDQLVVWREAQVFSPAERVALAWTEALTRLDRDSAFGDLRVELQTHFSDEEISVITADVGMINLWNRVQKSKV